MTIDINDISVHYNDFFTSEQVIFDANLTVKTGQVLGLVGKNGAGKTTLIKTMLGLIAPSSGTVSLMGEKPRHGQDIFKNIGYVPETPSYPETFTISNGLDYYAAMYKTSISTDEKENVLNQVGLLDQKQKTIDACSKGMKQRFALGVCMIKNLDLLILDEPIRGLDPLGQEMVRTFINEQKQQNTTIIISSHALNDVTSLCDRIAIMSNGTIKKELNPDGISGQNPDQPYLVTSDSVSEMPNYVSKKNHTQHQTKVLVPHKHLINYCQYLDSNNYVLYSIMLADQSGHTIREVLEQS